MGQQFLEVSLYRIKLGRSRDVGSRTIQFDRRWSECCWKVVASSRHSPVSQEQRCVRCLENRFLAGKGIHVPFFCADISNTGEVSMF